jgi:6-phosphogluconolactonase (cycloisomerase 2 family)
LFAALSFNLNGCGGSSSPSGTGPANPPPQTHEFLYGLGGSSWLTDVLAFQVDIGSGKLTPIQTVKEQSATCSASTSVVPTIVAASPATFLYANDCNFDGVVGYSIGPDGMLTPVHGSPFILPTTPAFGYAYVADLVINPKGTALYAVDTGTGLTYELQIDSATGTLTLMPNGLPNGGLGLSPTGWEQATIDPSGQFLYGTNTYTGIFDASGNELSAVAGFKIQSSSGDLEPLANSPFTFPASITQPGQIVVDPTGKFVYTPYLESETGVIGGDIAGFIRDPTTGELTAMPGSPFFSQPGKTYSQTESIGIHPSGKFLYAINAYGSTISGFTIDPSSGALSLVPGSPFPCQFSGSITSSTFGPIALDPSGAYLYALCDDSEISIYRVNQTTGALSAASGSPEPISEPTFVFTVVQTP